GVQADADGASHLHNGRPGAVRPGPRGDDVVRPGPPAADRRGCDPAPAARIASATVALAGSRRSRRASGV
ncbi:MAG: hypothetical protein AVDCRST_MAG19-4591, partial [uncultured Thermomicrobiales bacterium]